MNIWMRVGLALFISVMVGGVANAMVRKGAPHVRFVAVGPMGMKIEGTSAALDVKDDTKSIVVDVPFAPLRTGIALRDRHMRDEYLEVAKFPDARLSVDRSAIQLPKGAPIDVRARGQLTLHGQTHTVAFQYHAAPSGDGIDVTGTLHVQMTDYGIRVPNYLGVTVKPGVDIDVHFRVVP